MSWLHAGGSRQLLGDGRAWGKPPSATLELATIADYLRERGLMAGLATGCDWTCRQEARGLPSAWEKAYRG